MSMPAFFRFSAECRSAPRAAALVLLVLCSTLVGSSLVAAAEACPGGQVRVCVGACFCAPADAPWLAEANRVAGQALRNWVLQSRERALSGEVRPIPLHIRAQLEGYFDLRVLDSVRYRVGDDIPRNLTHALLQNPDVQAVTLVDLIVFQNAADADANVALWAHELTHVQQYQSLGVDEFTARYARDYTALESPAYQMQSRVAYALKQAAAAQAGAGPSGGPSAVPRQ